MPAELEELAELAGLKDERGTRCTHGTPHHAADIANVVAHVAGVVLTLQIRQLAFVQVVVRIGDFGLAGP